MAKILVTGANGFVGRAVCGRLARQRISFVPAVRNSAAHDHIEVGDINAATDWSFALKDVESVVHLAARVHVMDERTADSLAAFREVNVAGTENLARQAASRGVRRFVFVSSIKVNGENTLQAPFSSTDIPAPQDAYGRSKYEAELALARIAEETGMEVVVARPPLVYGPGVRANFFRLMQLVKRGLPLPIAAIDNRRSMVALDNLIDLLLTCARHPAAAGKTFLVSDGHDVSTPELVQMLAAAMDRRAFLVPIPEKLLAAGAALLGKSDTADRLLGSLQVDMAATQSVLDWRPPVSMTDAIGATVAHFLSHSRSS